VGTSFSNKKYVDDLIQGFKLFESLVKISILGYDGD